MPNVFDQFDEPKSPQAGNVFDQFDDQLEPASLTKEEFFERFGDIPDIGGLIKEETPQTEEGRSIGETLQGVGETALTIGTGAVGGTLGMIGGAFQGIVDEIRSGEFGSNEAANRIEKRANELMAELTYAPRTEAGQEMVGAIGEAGEALAPLAGLAAPLQQAGQLGRAAATGKGAAISKAVEPVKETGLAVFKYQSPVKQRIGRLIEQGSSDVETARFKVDTPSAIEPPKSKLLQALDSGGPKIAKDKTAITAIDQGFDEGVIASIKGAAPADRQSMAQMLNIFEKGKKDALFKAKNRPTDVVGKRIVDTFDAVKKANKKAGSDIDAAANSLKGLSVDARPAGDKFMTAIDDMGIKVGDDGKLNFEGSDVENLPAIERIYSTVFKRMSGPEIPDAYKLHQMKRFLDTQISYGKGGEGLVGKSESVLKDLRRDIDGILDNNFKEYDRANSTYADTITALNDIQSVAGKKIDLSGDNANKALGTLMRRILGESQGRVNVIEAAEGLERTAKKYPSQLAIEGAKRVSRQPDIAQLVLFADELDSRFGPAARGGLQGQVEKVAARGRNIAQSGSATLAASDAIIGGAARGIDKIKGMTDEKAIKAMRELLKQGDK